MEIPFLHLTPSGSKQLKAELEGLIQKLKEKPLSPGALEQLEKMVRNARFEGAHNRFYAPNHSAEGAQREVETLVYQLSQALTKNDNRVPAIPEFIVNRNVKSRGDRDACELKAKKLLLDSEVFLDKYTDHGHIYHGTSVVNILSIIRNGLVVSNSKQGTAVFGRGAYASPDRKFAGTYGTPIDFRAFRISTQRQR